MKWLCILLTLIPLPTTNVKIKWKMRRRWSEEGDYCTLYKYISKSTFVYIFMEIKGG